MIIIIDRSNLFADIEYRPRQTIICPIGDRDKEWVMLFNCGIQVPRTGDRQTDRRTDRQTDTETDRQTDTERERPTDRPTDRQTDRQADRDRERQQRQRQTDRQAGRHTDIQRHTKTGIDRGRDFVSAPPTVGLLRNLGHCSVE